MERVCFTLQVNPKRLEEYKSRHRDVWPEMQRALRESGWHNYSLFLREDGLLIGYFESNDSGAALADMANTEINDRWQREMAPFFVNLPNGTPDRSISLIDEVFHLPSE